MLADVLPLAGGAVAVLVGARYALAAKKVATWLQALAVFLALLAAAMVGGLVEPNGAAIADAAGWLVDVVTGWAATGAPRVVAP